MAISCTTCDDLEDRVDQLEEDLDEASYRIENLESADLTLSGHWTADYCTSEKLGEVYDWARFLDNDIEILKSATPTKLPRIVSIEVDYSTVVWGFKVNYAFVETEYN